MSHLIHVSLNACISMGNVVAWDLMDFNTTFLFSALDSDVSILTSSHLLTVVAPV